MPIMLTIVGATVLLAITGFIVLRTRTEPRRRGLRPGEE